MFLGGFILGRIRGIEIFIDSSLFVVFVLIAFGLGTGLFPAWHPEWTAAMHWGAAVLAALLLFASVLVHELSHALVGRVQGMPVSRVTLFVFGGMAHLEAEPRTWRAELWTSVAGPLVSLLLGTACLVLGVGLAADQLGSGVPPRQWIASLNLPATLLLWLGEINLLLAAFNLIPAFPLDGGRVLRAALWGWTGTFTRATRTAARLGQAFSCVLIAAGLAMLAGVDLPVIGGRGAVAGIWVILIGWFLNNAASMGYRQVTAAAERGLFEALPVSRVMRRNYVGVDADMRLGELVEKHLVPGKQRAFPVLYRQRFAGLISLENVRAVSRDAWSRTSVKDVMIPAGSVGAVRPGEDVGEALHALARNSLSQLPVVENGVVRGLIWRDDLSKLSTLYRHAAIAK
jgi:Zn-dependent protease